MQNTDLKMQNDRTKCKIINWKFNLILIDFIDLILDFFFNFYFNAKFLKKQIGIEVGR